MSDQPSIQRTEELINHLMEQAPQVVREIESRALRAAASDASALQYATYRDFGSWLRLRANSLSKNPTNRRNIRYVGAHNRYMPVNLGR